MDFIMRSNGFCQGIKIKREPTWEETLHCLNEIIGFDVDYALSLDYEMDDENDRESQEEERQSIHKAFIKYIQGDISWNVLCDELYVYEDIDSFYIGNIAYLIDYLEKQGIV